MFGQLDIIFNPKFTGWLPVWVWVIEHPEGIYVIDTGISANIVEKGYFRPLSIFSRWVNNTLFKFRITPDDAPDKQLKHLGISISDIKAVILTHLHIDHIDGLKYFPNVEILVNKLEWEQPSGDVPKLYPSWFKPVLIDLNEKYDVFENTKSITASNDVKLIHTPGHTKGHASVLLKTDQANIIFAGDICYYEDQLKKNFMPELMQVTKQQKKPTTMCSSLQKSIRQCFCLHTIKKLL